jgi:hypothetical protein
MSEHLLAIGATFCKAINIVGCWWLLTNFPASLSREGHLKGRARLIFEGEARLGNVEIFLDVFNERTGCLRELLLNESLPCNALSFKADIDLRSRQLKQRQDGGIHIFGLR